MTPPIIGMALAAILLTTIGQAMLKHGMDGIGGIAVPGSGLLASVQEIVTAPFILGGFALIALSIPVWLHVLSRLPLSVAHPLVSVGYVISVGIGVVILKEALTPLRIVGVALIILGVVAVSRG